MKLQILTLQAFGPYKDKQIIDFASLNEKQLFLVTGPTGSGKTTIFDAITFALFGRSSGESREVDGLISQYRSLEEPSYVELTFTLKEKTYTIYRQPKQMLPRARGKGYVEKASEAKLITDDQVYTAVNEVNRTIIELLGIDDTQFRQIVMLPQGEFQKLLEAKSSEKEQIFRKIFKTNYYKQFQDLIREKAKDMNQVIKRQEIELKELIGNINHYDDETLDHLRKQESLNYVEIMERIETLNDRLAEEIQEIIGKRKQLAETLRKYEEEFHKGTQLNEQIDEWHEAKQKYQSLLERKDAIKQLEQTITQMVEAKFIFETEKALNNLMKKINDLDHERKQLCEQLNDTEKNKETIKDDLRIASKDYQQLDPLKEKRQDLQNKREKVNEWKNLKEVIQELEKLLEAQIQQKEQTEQEKRDLESERAQLETIIQGLEKELERLRTVSLEMVKQKQRCDRLQEAKQTLEQLISLNEKHRQQANAYESFHQMVQKEDLIYQEDYHLYLKSQAGILAKTLVEGEPCPVCGSPHHPTKATLLDTVKTKEELDNERQRVDQLKRNEQIMYQELLAVNEQIHHFLQQFNRYKIGQRLTREQLFDMLPIVEAELIEAIALEKTQYEDYEKEEQHLLQRQDELKGHRERHQSLQSLLNQKVEAIESLQKQYLALQQQYHEKQGQLKTMEDAYHFSTLDVTELDEAIQSLNQQIVDIEEKYHTLESRYNQVMRELVTLKTKLESLEKQLEATQKEYDEVSNTFQNQLRNAEFEDEEAYRKLSSQSDNLSELQQKLEQYHHDWNYYRKRINELERIVDGKEKVDLEKLNETIVEIGHTLEEMNEVEKDRYAILSHNQQLMDKMVQIYEEKNKQIEAFERFNLLNKVTNGDNVYKLTFERYVLTAYFDEIIHAANIRLREMTERRYTLLRDTEYSGGRGHQGLDLLVFDAYTNQKRSVKTLSGGESFIASLSLALGLADIVSSYAGGIQLDTIFIDEGFGSLDPVALDHAIGTLNNLKSTGRTVGIISHVQELRERIDAQVEIVKTKEGSFIRHRL